MTFNTLSSRIRRGLHVAALVSALGAGTTGAWAQATGAVVGTISGRVTDAKSKIAFDGVRVSVTVNGVTYETTTDQQGGYVLVNVPAGDATVAFTYIGLPAQTLPVKVGGGEVAHLDLTMGQGDTAQGRGDVVKLGDFVVSGAVLGSARAVNDQRNALSLTNILAADAIGQLPDKNMAEAIQRLPGIDIAKDKGEGRYILIRGIPPTYVGLSMNGVRMASTEKGTRESAVDVISASLIGSIEVSKVTTPDVDGDSMGGSANLKTRSGLDQEGTVARFSAGSNFAHQENLKGGYNLAATYGEPLLGGKLGFIVDVASEFRPFTVYSEPTTGWSLVKSPTDGQQHWIVASQDFRHYDAKRWRHGASTALDYKFSDTSKVWVRLFATNYNQKNQQWLTTFPFAAGTVSALTDTTATTSIKAGGIIKSETQIVNNKRFESAVAGYDGTFGSWTNNFATGYTAGKYTRPTLALAFANTTATVVSYAFNGVYDNNVTQISGPSIGSPSSYTFSTKSAYSNTTSNTHEVTVRDDLRNDFTVGALPAYVKVGAEYREKYNNIDGSKWAITSAPWTLNDATVYPGYDYQDKMGGFPNFQIRQEQVQSYYDNQGAYGKTLTASTTYGGAFAGVEKIDAGYAMGGLRDGKFKALGGVRYEETDFHISGWQVNATTGAITPVTTAHSYSNVLPSAIFTYEFDPRTIARASWGNTLARPDYNSTAPGRAVDDTKKTVTQGNVNLPSLTAMNWDASLEHYYSRLGSVSAAVFYKTIKNFTYSAQAGIDPATGYNLTSFLTAPSAKIYGTELSWQQRFGFLPAPFNRFGIQTNAIFGNSEATYPTRPGEKLQFPGYGHKFGNLALTYAYSGLNLRAAVHYHDARLLANSTIGADATQDEHEAEYYQIDVGGSYRLNDHWNIYLNFSNINNAQLKTFFGGTGSAIRLDTFEAYGWSTEGGISWNL
jgi:TonB-dependent receptor